MPHCINEYSVDLKKDLDRLMAAVHDGVLESGLFKPEDVKTRALAFDHWVSSEGDQQFLHVTVRLFAGRSPEEKQALSRSILNLLEQLAIKNISITVEMVDIDTDSYSKRVT